MEENQVSPLVAQDKESPLLATGETNVVDTDESLKKFVALSAFAKLPTVQTDDTPAAFRQIKTENEAKLNLAGGDKTVLENEVRSREMEREVNVVRQAKVDPIASSEYLASAFKRITGTAYPVEAAAAESMVLAGTLDEEFESEYDEDDILPSVYEQQIELATKRAILMEESYKQAQTMGIDMVGERDGLEHFITLTEFLPFLVPVINTIPLGGNVPGVEENLGDQFLPGVQVREETAYLMDLPMDEFEKLAPEAVAKTYKNTFSVIKDPFGNYHPWQNKLAQELLLEQFNDPASAEEINAFAVLDVAGLLYAPAKMGAKGLASLDILKGFGARRTAARLAADILRQSEEVGAVRAAEEAGTTVDDVISSSIMKALDIEDGVVSGVSSGDEVINIMQTTDDLIKEAKVSSLKDLNRLKPEELARAIQNTIEKFQKRTGRKVRPTDVQAYNATPGSGIYTPALRIIVGKADGGGYRGPRALSDIARFADRVGLKGYKIKYIDRATEVVEPPPFGRLPPEFDEVLISLPKRLKKAVDARKKADTTGLADMGKGMSSAITDNFYKGWFDTLSNGPNKSSAFKNEPQFKKTKELFDNGQIKTLEDLEKFLGRTKPKTTKADTPQLYVPKSGETAQQSFDEIQKFAIATGDNVQVLVTKDGNMIAGSSKDFPNGLANELGLADDVGIAVVAPKSKFKDLNDFYRSVRTKDNQKFMLKDEGLDKVDTNVPGVKASVVRDETTREYYLSFDIGVEETGFFEAIRPKSLFGIPELGLARLFAGGRLIEDEWLYGFSALSEARRNSLVKLIKERFKPALQALNKKERDLLNKLARVQDRERRWMTDIELRDHYTYEFGVGTDTTKFLEAHTAFRKLNDLEWRLRNDALYSELSTQGWSTVGLKNIQIGNKAPATGKVDIDLTSKPRTKVFNAETGELVEWSDLDIKDLKDRKFVLVKYKDIQSFGNDNHMTRYVVAPLSSVEEAPLSRIQLGYREGGHRIYSPQVRKWIKGARKVKQSDGSDIMMNPITLYGGLTEDELRPLLVSLNEYVELAEARIKAIKSGNPRKGLAALLQHRSRNPMLPAVEDILKMVEDGRASSKYPFEIVDDRRMPSQYSIDPEAMPYVDNAGDAVYEHMRDTGRMYYSERGDEIKIDYLGDELPVLDVYEALAQSVNNITNIVAFGPYKISKMERWVKAYKDILEINGNMSLQQMFQAPVKQNLPPGLSAKAVMAEKQRSITRRLLNWVPPEGRTLDNAWNSIIHAIDNIPGTVEQKQGRLKIADAWAKTIGLQKGANFLKGVGFEFKLGFLNIAQVPLQLATTLSIMGIDTTKTLNAISMYPFIRKFVPDLDDASFIKMFSTAAGKAYSGFEDPYELLEMLKTLKREVGFSIVNRTYAALDDVTEGSLFNGVAGLQNTAEKISEISRFFFYESEKANKYVAYSVAWKMVREEAPDLAWNSQEFSMKVTAKAETLAHGMGQASSAAWQKSNGTVAGTVISSATQFWSYPVRALEMALGTQLTYQQKLRYFLGQAVLFGSAGPPMIAFLEDLHNKQQGLQNFENKPIETGFERGLIDTMLYYGTGADVLYGERAGTGRWLEDVIREAVGMSRYGVTSPAEMAGGASFSIFWDAASGMGEFITDTNRLAFSKDFSPDESFQILTSNMAENARVISTWNNVTKYLSAQKFQEIYSRQTNPVFGPSRASTVMAEDLTSFEAVLVGLFGLSPGEQREVSQYIAIGKDRKMAIMDYVNEIKRAELQYAQAYDANDADGRRNALVLRDSLFRLVPNDMYMEVFAELDKYDHTQSITESLARTYQKNEINKKVTQEIGDKMKDGE